jgi:hypothetical protein
MTHFRVIVASLAGAALLAGPVAAQQAQKGPDAQKKQPPAAAAATSSKPETVEQRITTLKTSLKITPEQESKWTPVAQAMRENAANMDKLVQAKKGKAASLTAVDDLMTYQEFAQAHVDGLKNLIPAFKALYDSMPDDQKKNADAVFEKFGPAGNGRPQRQQRQG